MTSYKFMLGEMESTAHTEEKLPPEQDTLETPAKKINYEDILLYSLASKDDLNLTPNS